MSEVIHYPDGRVEHPAVRHEPRDANFRWILGILLGAAAIVVLVFVGVWLFFVSRRDHADAVKKSPFPLASAPSTALPQEPRLEQVDRLAGHTPNVYLRQALREATLNSYGPTKEPGYVHIPISQAIEQLAAKPLPAHTAPSAEQERRSSGLVDAGESSSGRMFRRGQP